MTLLLWRYRRVSTDNKGQDPKRQQIATDAWAQREGATIIGDTEDKGTSATFTEPLDRPLFLEACHGARTNGAQGILAESVDRVCGGGGDELGHVRYTLRKQWGLELYFADVPHSMHGTIGGNVTATANAEVRRDRIATDRRRMREGIKNRRDKCATCGARRDAWRQECPRSPGRACAGLPVGGQTQQKVTPELVALVLQVQHENPKWGLRRLAHEVSARRGAHLASLTESERRKRKVTHETVRAALQPSNGSERQTEAQTSG